MLRYLSITYQGMHTAYLYSSNYHNDSIYNNNQSLELRLFEKVNKLQEKLPEMSTEWHINSDIFYKGHADQALCGYAEQSNQ